MEFISVEQIIQAMKTPENLSPRLVRDAYVFLSAVYAEKHVQLSAKLAVMASKEAELVTAATTSAKARQLVKGSPDGVEAIRLTGDINALEQLINALKRAQAFAQTEASNQF